jgi:hypothetical protein
MISGKCHPDASLILGVAMVLGLSVLWMYGRYEFYSPRVIYTLSNCFGGLILQETEFIGFDMAPVQGLAPDRVTWLNGNM